MYYYLWYPSARLSRDPNSRVFASINVNRSMGHMVRQFIHHVMPGVVRPLHVLWNQVIGFLFVVLAVLPVPSVVRNVRDYQGDAESFFRVSLSVTFGALMLYFGISSFLRARKISRS